MESLFTWIILMRQLNVKEPEKQTAKENEDNKIDLVLKT